MGNSTCEGAIFSAAVQDQWVSVEGTVIGAVILDSRGILIIRSDIFIMQRRKRLPNIVPKQTLSDFHPPTRRRNLSLSSNPTHPPDPPHPPPANIKLQVLTRCYSKKNKLFLFSDKMHRARDLTKLCQENVSEYLSLKNSLRKVEAVRKPSVQSEGKAADTSPKLSIKLLNVPLNLTLKNTFYPANDGSTRKLRMRTEHSPTKHTKMRVSLEMGPMPLPLPATPLSPKKYNELTLRQIVESEEEVSQRMQLFQKIRILKERLREGVGQALERREEEPLAGW